MHPKFTFVLGGAASGKSAIAETIVRDAAKTKIYVATAQVFDPEMQARVETHQARRDDGWTTIEAPLDLITALSELTDTQVCLLDCATLWLSNQMLAENDLTTEQDRLLQAIECCAADLVVVSNEVGQGIVPDTALARRFREAQGRLNIALAARADRVVHVVAGLAQVLKEPRP